MQADRIATAGDGHRPQVVEALGELGAGDALHVDADGATAHRGVVQDAAPWRSGRVVFDGVTLAEAIAAFERYADTGIVIDDPAVRRLGIHGSFDLQALGAFLRMLPQVLPVQVQSTADGRHRIDMRR